MRSNESVSGLRNQLDSLERKLQPFTETVIQMPSGVQGFDAVVNVLGQMYGFVPSTGPLHPFKIIISTTDSGIAQYKVAKGSITEGTNGPPLPITGLDEKKDASEGIVFIEGDVSDYVITNLKVTLGDNAVEEVEITDSTQTKIILILGKITMDTTVSPPVATAWQAWTTSARAIYGMLNGAAVKVFDAAPTHPSEI